MKKQAMILTIIFLAIFLIATISKEDIYFSPEKNPSAQQACSPACNACQTCEPCPETINLLHPMVISNIMTG